MTKLIAVIDRLLALLDRWVAHQAHKKAQKARDAIEQNPADWFDTHFSNGVRSVDSSKADQTNTDNSKTK
jgi:hypothetical protein